MLFNTPTPRNLFLAAALTLTTLTTAAVLPISDTNTNTNHTRFLDAYHRTFGLPDVILKSHCPFPVYIREVIADTDTNPYHPYSAGSAPQILLPNSTWTSRYYWNHTGISLKLARAPWIPGTPEPLITQLEYTYEYDTRALWYDLSEIDCYNQLASSDGSSHCPFFEHGVVLRASPVCEVLACGPGNTKCADAYVTPEDGWETKCTTGLRPRLVAELCPRGFEGFVEGLERERVKAIAVAAAAKMGNANAVVGEAEAKAGGFDVDEEAVEAEMEALERDLKMD